MHLNGSDKSNFTKSLWVCFGSPGGVPREEEVKMARYRIIFSVVLITAVLGAVLGIRRLNVIDAKFDPSQYTSNFVGPRYLPKDNLDQVPVSFVQKIHKKFEKKHQSVTQQILAIGKTLNKFRKEGKKIPGLKVHIALLTELQRLKKEQKNLVGKSRFTTGEHLALIADSMMILEYLDILSAYGQALNEVVEVNGSPDITEESLLVEASKRFPSYYSERKRGKWAFADRDIAMFSSQGAKLTPLAASLFNENMAGLIEYRIQFFMGYADRIINNNRKPASR